MSKTVKEHCFARISVISQPFWLFLGSFRRVNPYELRVRVDAGAGQVELPVGYLRQSLHLCYTFRPSVTLRFIRYPHFRPPAYTVAPSRPSWDHDFTVQEETVSVVAMIQVLWLSQKMGKGCGVGSLLRVRKSFSQIASLIALVRA